MHAVTELHVGLLLQSDGSVAQRYTEYKRKINVHFFFFFNFKMSTELAVTSQIPCLSNPLFSNCTNKMGSAYFTFSSRIWCCPKRQITLLVQKSSSHINMIHLSSFPLQYANLRNLCFQIYIYKIQSLWPCMRNKQFRVHLNRDYY